MKWFRRIFGTPTQDELAQLLTDALRKTGATAIEYDPERFQLRLQTAGGVQAFKNLHNAHRAYSLARPWQRGTILRRFASTPWEIPPAATWEEAVPRLRPGVRDPYLFERTRLQAQLDGHAAFSLPPFRKITERVCVVLLKDYQEHMATVQASTLETWGVSFDQALETALANLEAVSAPRWINAFPGVYVSAWHDDYDASRLLLDSVLSGLDLPGVPVALVPYRSCLIVTGSESDEAVAQALALAEKVEATGPISTLPLRRTPSGWAPWELGEQHPSHETFRRLRLNEVGGISTDQKELLDALHEKEQIDVFVASFSALEEKSGLQRSFCTWTSGVLALLPRTDRVAFIDPERPKDQQIRGFFEWEKVEAHCGHLMQKTGDIPARYRIEPGAFPTDEDFQAMGPSIPVGSD